MYESTTAGGDQKAAHRSDTKCSGIFPDTVAYDARDFFTPKKTVNPSFMISETKSYIAGVFF